MANTIQVSTSQLRSKANELVSSAAVAVAPKEEDTESADADSEAAKDEEPAAE